MAFYLPKGYRGTLLASMGLLGVVGIFSAERTLAGSEYGLGVLFLVVVGLVACTRLYSVHTIPINRSEAQRALVVLSAVTLIGLAYGIIGYSLLTPRILHESPVSFIDALRKTVSAMVLPNELIEAPTRLSKLFAASINGVGLIIAFALLRALFQPFSIGSLSSTVRQRQRAQRIIEQTSSSSEDYFKLWPYDKNYFFSASNESFIAYKAAKRTLIILGDPCGKQDEFTDLVKKFCVYATQNGWEIAVINATSISDESYTANGLSALPIGHEAIVDIGDFVASTAKNKHFRYVMNKAKAQHLHVEELRGVSNAQLLQLKKISDSWLARNGRREYTFFMGYFELGYLRASRVFVLYQGANPVAYMNLIPTFYDFHASIDQFRSSDSAPSVGMHYLFSEVIKQLSMESVETLNIGFAPLSKLELLQIGPATKTALGLIKRFGNRYYSFQGIEQFKNKFDPTWHERTLLYTGSIAGLPGILREIDVSTTYNSFWSRIWPRLSIALGSVSLIIIIYIITQ